MLLTPLSLALAPLPLLVAACTTFGVCTSLGLGVSQLAAALVYMERYFTGSGIGSAGTASIAFNQSGLVGLIWGITLVATFSVVTGLDKGLQYLSLLAMTLCLIIMMFVLFADNTSYLLGVFVQTLPPVRRR